MPRRLVWPAGLPSLWFLLSLLATLLSMCAVPAAAQGGDAPVAFEAPRASAVLLSAQPRGIPLVGELDVLVDDDGNLDIDDIRSRAVAERFQRPAGVVGVWLDNRPRWFRLTVRQSGPHGDWVLVVPAVAVRDVQFFGPFDASGAALAPSVVTGMAHAFGTRPLASEQMLYRFSLSPGVDHTVYLRATTDISQLYRLAVWDTGLYLASTQTKRMLDGVAYGILFGMMAYNLMLMLAFRDSAYAYYVLSCGFAILAIASFNGHAARYLFPDFPQVTTLLYVATPVCWSVFSGLFGRQFLGLARRAPRLDVAVLGLCALSVVVVALAFAGRIGIANVVMETATMLGALVLLASALVSWRSGFQPARWYLAGLGVLFFWVFVTVLYNWGMVAMETSPLGYLQIAVAIEAVVFSFALGQRIQALRPAGSEQAAQADRLALAAHIDPLTGAVSRDGLADQWGRIGGDGRRHALLVVNLNQLRSINEHHGHQASDQALVEVARRLHHLVRPGDTVGRTGSDEFVLLLPSLHARAAIETLVLRLQQSMREPIVLGDASVQVGCCSIGVARFPLDGATLDVLLRSADRAMVHARSHGPANHAFHDDLPTRPRATVPRGPT